MVFQYSQQLPGIIIKRVQKYQWLIIWMVIFDGGVFLVEGVKKKTWHEHLLSNGYKYQYEKSD